jgi:hypothetical protein
MIDKNGVKENHNIYRPPIKDICYKKEETKWVSLVD